MKITAILMLTACLQVGATGYTQTVSLSLKDAQLETVFREIRKQTGYNFIFTREVISAANPVNINVQNASLKDVLEMCFQNQPLSFSIEDKFVVIKRKISKSSIEVPDDPSIDIQGKVFNNKGEPIAGATVMVKNSKQATATNERGEFFLPVVDESAILVISSIGHKSKEVKVQGRNSIEIQLEVSVSSLDETVVIAYGTTTRRLNTGSVSRVNSEEINKQPVSNALATMQGYIPGLMVTQRTGRPGSNYTIQIRGDNSLKQGTQPLFIIDGVPFMINTGSLSQQIPDVQSIFNTINPADIESIEVLKDADATAIYGSQGANGVVLITTKKGKPGSSKFDFNYYTGFGKVARSIDLLNTQQYLQMRKEAFANDGTMPTISNAPDLLVWDSSKFTSWQEELTGGTARTNNLQASLSGGNDNISFYVSANHFSETSVFPESKPVSRTSLRLNLLNTSLSKKFSSQFTVLYAEDRKKQPFADLTSFILLPPNAPALRNESGELLWTNGIENPYSQLLINYESKTSNLLANTSLKYNLLKNLSFKLDLGLNAIKLNEEKQTPIKSMRPSASATGTLQLSNGEVKSWIAEPQVNYTKQFGKNSINLLSGLSFQQRRQNNYNVLGRDYNNDDLIGSISAAGRITATNSLSQYNYSAFFARANYNFQQKYIVNLNVRRDGSSRFGPANRFSNFGAIGAAWIFSEELFFKDKISLINFGKLRASYGITGNDQIGDYQFFDTWSSSSSYQYDGNAGILPTRLFNANYQWEKNGKLEFALELGLFENKYALTASYYRNRSSNQLVFYKIPTQTGFSSILKNLDALIQNSGLEVELGAKIIENKDFAWQLNANISFPKNKLIRYPGLESSTDKYNFAIGMPLNSVRVFNYTGLDPSTGIYTFSDVDDDGKISSPNDLTTVLHSGPKYFGGIQSVWKYRQWNLSISIYGIKQTGRNYLTNITTRPGYLGNQPIWLMDRWQKPGNKTEIQKFTTTVSSEAFSSYNLFRNSSGLVTDASFLRLRNLSLSYELPESVFKQIKFKKMRLYVEGQNLFTITNYKGSDPETQNVLSLPPLRILATGIQFTF